MFPFAARADHFLFFPSKIFKVKLNIAVFVEKRIQLGRSAERLISVCIFEADISNSGAEKKKKIWSRKSNEYGNYLRASVWICCKFLDTDSFFPAHAVERVFSYHLNLFDILVFPDGLRLRAFLSSLFSKFLESCLSIWFCLRIWFCLILRKSADSLHFVRVCPTLLRLLMHFLRFSLFVTDYTAFTFKCQKIIFEELDKS